MARLRLRPEAVAVWPALAVGAIGAAALAYNANAVWLVLCLVLAAVGGGAAVSLRRLRGVRIEVPPPPVVFAGEPAQLDVGIELPAPMGGVLIQVDAEAQRTPSARGWHRMRIDLGPRVRGIAPLGLVRASTSFPMGVVRCEAAFAVATPLVVAPHPAGRRLHPAVDEGAHGESRLGTHAADFAGHLAYRPGHRIAGIDWRAAARGQGLLSKQWEGRGSGEVWFDWDACSGDAELRLSQLCRWVCDAHEVGLRFGLRLPGRILPPDHGDAHRRNCLLALAGFRPA